MSSVPNYKTMTNGLFEGMKILFSPDYVSPPMEEYTVYLLFPVICGSSTGAEAIFYEEKDAQEYVKRRREQGQEFTYQQRTFRRFVGEED